MKKFEDAKFDVRMIKRSISRGTVDPKEYEEYLKNLPDESGNAEVQKVYSEDENLLTFSSVEKA